MKEKIDWRIIITAIIAIAGLEAWALWLGFNGALLATVLAILAGIAGWSMPQLKIQKV